MKEYLRNRFKTWKYLNKYYTTFADFNFKIHEKHEKEIHSNEFARGIHNTYYSHLLFDYVINVKKTLKQKRRLKTLFFIVIMGIFVWTFFSFYTSSIHIQSIIPNINKKNSLNKDFLFETLTIIVPSLISLVVAFIKIPEIIAKYLFNTKEDEYMTSIIKNLQDYDKSLFESSRKKLFAKLDDKNLNNDDTVNDIPDGYENTLKELDNDKNPSGSHEGKSG